MSICKNGHINQAGGCCCPAHGNTCGYHPEYDEVKTSGEYETLAEYIHTKEREEEDELISDPK